jgi:preprotein translocase subunit SecY
MPQSQKANRIAMILIIAIMFFSSFVKSFFHRALPGKELIDFIAYPAFNEQWLSIQKFLWHFVLDVLVFCIVCILKNSYRLFERKK